jgi:hypothetical protein
VPFFISYYDLIVFLLLYFWVTTMYLVVLFLLDIGKRRSRERRRMIGMRSK